MVDHQEQQLQRLQLRFRTTVFDGLYTESAEQRALALDNITNLVQSWAATRSTSTADEETELLLRHHLLIILRMSVNCPFPDVQRRFAMLLGELRQQPGCQLRIPKPIHESPSFFISKDRLVRFGEESPLARRVMESGFISNGRFSNVFRLMIYFPSFLERFFATFNRTMRLPGPLPRHWRNYIAIMGACQHKCQYLVSLQRQEFLQNGGDPNWLQGLQMAPQKLQALAQLNTLLAHQPWRVTKEHISTLIRGPGGGDSNWSKSELVQAVVVLTTFHSLASFVLGCGVTPEIDMIGGSVDDESAVIPDERLSVSSAFESEEIEEYTAELLQRLKSKNRYEEESTESTTMARQEVFQSCDTKETFMSTLKKPSRFEHASPDSKTAELEELWQPRPSAAEQAPISPVQNTQSMSSSLQSIQSINAQYEDLNRFTSGSNEIKHVDFDFKSNEYTIFRLQDYNWEEHGCSLVSKYLPETGELLDEEFSEILNLTDYSIFASNTTSANSPNVQQQDKVDTWPFRQAVWYYVLRLTGMSHDDYNYHEVNIYLNKRIKLYIKKVACYPEAIVPSDFHNMGFNFRPDEKCQINLLAAEARRCAELLYALHAVMKFDVRMENCSENVVSEHSLRLKGRKISTLELCRLFSNHYIELSTITQLDLSRNRLCSLPPTLAKQAPHLARLNLSFNNLQSIPDVVLSLTQLTELDLSRNCIQGPLPSSMPMALTQLQCLRLADNKITDLPSDMSGWASYLHTLLLGSECLGGNQLSRLPMALGQLTELRELDLSMNRIEFLDESLASLYRLERLSLYANQLHSISPFSLAKLRNLRTLILCRNQLTRLPDELCQLDRLELVDVSNNRLEEFSVGMGAFLRMRSTLLTGNSFSCPAACRKSLEPVAAAAAFGAQPSHRVVLPLVELAARAVLAQPQLNWCKGQLPEGLHRYLEGAGGGCTVCRNTRFVREFNTALINDPSFLGFPNVARRIKICSQQCDSRWRLSDHAKHLSQW